MSRLGWNIIRIWTLDWLDDKERVLRNIRTAIENITEKEEPSAAAVTAAKPYINAPVMIRGTAEAFYLPQNKSAIKKAAEEVISAEAPSAESSL